MSNISDSNEIYIAPSGVQKERIQPEDLFVQNIEGDDLQFPPEYKKYYSAQLNHVYKTKPELFCARLTKSQCTPLFLLAYRHRGAGAVIHTHSQHAVMATLLWSGDEFRCTHLEMIKVFCMKSIDY